MKGFLTLALCVALCAPAALAQHWNSTKLIASDGTDADEFGIAVALAGDYALVGAHRDRPKGSYSGAAYVFARTATGWQQKAKLIPGDIDSYHRFGWSVAMSGDYAIIGAKGDFHSGKNSGSAYIFKRQSADGASWREQIKLVKSGAARDEEFGYAVALQGEYAVVGAWGEEEGRGAAYVYQLQGSDWIEQARLVAGNRAAEDRFGGAIAIDGNHILIGAPQPAGRGAAYIFARGQNGWQQQLQLSANEAAAGDAFGHAVALAGDYAFVAAPGDDDRGEDAGAVYVFKRNAAGSWQQSLKLHAAAGAAGDGFGSALASSGARLLAGAYHDDERGANSGSAHLFTRNTGAGQEWIEQAKLTANDGAAGDEFGIAVALDVQHAVVGAWYHDEKSADAGAAYLYRLASPAAVADEAGRAPQRFVLEQNRPNPFNFGTSIYYRLEESGEVQLAIYGLNGQRIRMLFQGRQPAGAHRASWDGRDEAGHPAASGIYFCRLQAGAQVQMRKMAFAR